MRHRSGPRSGRKYPRRGLWLERRNAAYERAGRHCEISLVPLRVVSKWNRACDHIIPERFVRRWFKSADPHVLENLVVVTPSLHTSKTVIEWKLFRGDTVGYYSELRRLGYSQELIDRAWKAIIASQARCQDPNQ